MPTFKYKARDNFSKPVTGKTTAENRDAAAKKLMDMGYTPISITEARDSGYEKIFEGLKRISLEEVNTFTRQLYSLQKAGLPLLSSLEAIAQQTKNQRFQIAIQEITQEIRAGKSLSDALKAHSSVFDSIYAGMIKAAESSGSMAEILEKLTQLIEREIDTRSRIKAATRYPTIAFGVLCLGFFILVTFVIPRFAVIYSQFNTALPLPTRILIGLNIALKKFWFLSILCINLIIFGFLRFINSAKGRPAWDNFKLNIPVIGTLIKMLIMSRFARVTAILMKSGVTILEILEIVANTCGNVIIARAIGNIKISVSQGKGISEPMKVSGLFPPAVIQMVSTGEKSGKVDELLLHVSDYYDRESGYMIKNLSTYIEPMLIFILAVMVLVLALAIFLPMWNLIKLFRPA